MTIGVGMLGSGFMAHTYAECLARHVTGAELRAIACGTRAPALAQEYGVALVPDERALLARPDIEMVIIATPHSTHRPLTIAAAAAGRHVYLEKPMGLTVAECDAMIAACRNADVKLTVNTVTRFRQSPSTAKRLLDTGAIGQLRMVRITSSVVGYVAADTHGWALDPGEGGGWLDMGVHLFDALRWFTGSDAAVVFARVEDFGGLDLRRSGMAELVMRNGVMAQLWISHEMPRPGIGSQSQWLLVGSTGIIESDSYGKVRVTREGAWEPVFEMPWFDLNADVYSPIRLKGFAAQVQDLVDAVAEDREPIVTGEDGRAAVELVEATARSSATGEAVRLPLTVAG
jgi:predicted dehydrogenase